MLINFALDVVGTKITSDKVSTDGYDCSNLISNNWHLRRKGFLAEYFIKPPVNLTFEFPCNICIHHVFVTPCVGQQRSSHLELYSTSKLPQSAASYFQKQKPIVSKGNTAALPDGYAVSKAQSNSHHNPSLFCHISKISVQDGDRICFSNSKVNALFNSDMPTDNFPASNHRAEIQCFRQNIISASSHLTLRIVRTVSGSAAAVSSIDIWGLAALSVPASIRDDIVNKYTSFINHSLTKKDSEIVKHDKKVVCIPTSVSDISSADDSLEIPEDFIDPITCDVMAVPMLLPSGKTVDLSTLDHYFNVEASYGRQPRDPFTGLQFSNTSKPIPNGGLKARIDKFLMEHCSDAATSTIARTVRSGNRDVPLLGKRKKSTDSSDGVSSLVSQNSDRHLIATNNDCSKVSISEGFQLINLLSVESQKSKTLPQHKNLLHARKNDYYTETSHQCAQHQQTVNVCSGTNNGHSHETQLKNSLDSALSSILSSMPSYLSKCESSTNSNLCSLCKQTLAVDKASYITPCHHYMCRECLTSDSAKTVITCGVCGHIFSSSNVLRRHQIV